VSGLVVYSVKAWGVAVVIAGLDAQTTEAMSFQSVYYCNENVRNEKNVLEIDEMKEGG